MTKIVVNSGNGDDNITLAVDSPVDVNINTESGDDIVRVKPSTTNTLNVDGGDHNIGDVLIAGPAENIKHVKVETAAVEIDGFQPVNFINVEKIVGLDRNARRQFLNERTPW